MKNYNWKFDVKDIKRDPISRYCNFDGIKIRSSRSL